MLVQTEQKPEVNTDGIQTDQTEYNESCQKYERLANLRLRNSDTIILGGYGCFIKVSNSAFVVEYQKPHEPGTDKVLRLNRGIHKIKQIVITVHGGYITLDAIEWACQQNITLYLMDYKGQVLQVLTPKQHRNVKLAYLQQQASESSLGIDIAREMIHRKIQSQIDALKTFPERESIAIVPVVRDKKVIFENGQGRLFRSSICQFLNDSLVELPNMKTIGTIQMYESNLAKVYWDAFMDVPITWDKKSAKIVPPHWLSISGRRSMLSQNGKNATNPFHAVLNFAYALLEAQSVQAITIAGLEPTIGFLHTRQEYMPALAWDVMECFRAVVDHMVFSLFQKTVFHKGDFRQELSGECRMGNEELKRYVLASCRVDYIKIDQLCRWLRSTLEGTHGIGAVLYS